MSKDNYIKKFFLIFVLCLLLLTLFCGFWIYWSFKASEFVNNNVNHKFSIKDFDSSDQVILGFERVFVCGLPRRLGFCIEGVTEETPASEVFYRDPVFVGYDILKQAFFVSYSGDVDSFFKPKNQNFGNKIKVNEYNFFAKIRLADLFDILYNKNLLSSHIKQLKFVSSKIEFFDRISNEKILYKDHEELKISFPKDFHILNINNATDGISLFGSEDKIELEFDYKIKNSFVAKNNYNIPDILLLSFINLSDSFSAKATGTIVAQSNVLLSGLRDNFQLSTNFALITSFLDLENAKLQVIADDRNEIKKTQIAVSMDFLPKAGIASFVAEKYKNRPSNKKYLSSQNFILQQVDYFFQNPNLFSLVKLEGNKYNFNLEFDFLKDKYHESSSVKDFSFFGSDSGIKLEQDYILQYPNQDKSRYKNKLKGRIFVKNYETIVDLLLADIYKLAPFRYQPEDTRKLYIDTIKDLVKLLSDHPKSSSKDLSTSYDILSGLNVTGKIGTVSIEDAHKIYNAIILRKLIDKVGIDGNVQEKIDSILPRSHQKELKLDVILPRLKSKKIKDLINNSVRKKSTTD